MSTTTVSAKVPKELGLGDMPCAFRISQLTIDLLAALLERIGDVLKEDEAEGDVLVLRRVHVPAHLVRRLPQRLLEAQRRAVVGVLALSRHVPIPSLTSSCLN